MLNILNHFYKSKIVPWVNQKTLVHLRNLYAIGFVHRKNASQLAQNNDSELIVLQRWKFAYYKYFFLLQACEA